MLWLVKGTNMKDDNEERGQLTRGKSYVKQTHFPSSTVSNT